MMGKLGQMMGLGGGMPMPTPEQIEAMQKQMGGAGAAAALPSGPPGIPAAPPPGAFNLPPQFPGLGGGRSCRASAAASTHSGARRNDFGSPAASTSGPQASRAGSAPSPACGRRG